MKICLTGDTFLGGDLSGKNMKDIVNVKSFNSADQRIINLEQPISNSDKVFNKGTLYTDSYAVQQLKELKVNAVNLAHNHIQDKGLDGISETMKYLLNNDIKSFGAGKNLEEAKKPYHIKKNIVVLGYCEFDKIYLNQIVVASKSKAGVNPLRYENIIDDLNKLNHGTKAILYFHWGREHVFLPTYDDIQLVKKLLEDDRVLLIVGMHPHRPQGYIEHNNKKAYMCLGNFLFPNFFIKPPAQIYNPKNIPEKIDITRQYHKVFKQTYKKWRWINRISLVLTFDTTSFQVTHKLTKQDDDYPIVNDYKGFGNYMVMFFLWFLSKVYKLPKFLYTPLEKINSFLIYKIWNLQILFFQKKQIGLKKISNFFK